MSEVVGLGQPLIEKYESQVEEYTDRLSEAQYNLARASMIYSGQLTLDFTQEFGYPFTRPDVATPVRHINRVWRGDWQ